jgi:hypothetical protein
MRGQAFVSFASADSARKAMKDIQRFPLYSKPMVRFIVLEGPLILSPVQQISFARTRSDAVVKKVDGDNFDEHKARRDEHKSTLHHLHPPDSPPLYFVLHRDNAVHESPEAKIPREEDGGRKCVASTPASFFLLIYVLAVDGAAAAPAPKRPNVQMPDEYLPPNKILFLQNLPESVTKDQLMALFSQFRQPFLYCGRLLTMPTGTPTYTKSVSSQRNGTLLSWSSWTRGARESQRMHYTTTSWTGKTRSRSIFSHPVAIRRSWLLALQITFARK